MTKRLDRWSRGISLSNWSGLISADPKLAAPSADSVGLFLSDVGGGRAAVNVRWREMTGVSAAEDPCEGWTRAVHPEDRERVLREWEGAVRAGRPFESRYRLRDRAGTTTWVLGQGLVQRDPSGNATGFVGAITDITQALEDEAALRRSQERPGEALDAVVWDWDVATGEVRWAGDREALFGYGAGHLQPGARGMLLLVHPDDRARVRERLTAHLEGRTPTFACAHRLRTRSGAWRWSLVRGSVIERGADTRPLRIVGFELDISEPRKEWLDGLRAREQLQLLTRRLAVAEEGERRRIASALHDRLGHGLALAKIKLGMLQRAERSGASAGLTGEILGLLDEAIREIRSLTFELSPPVLHELGLEPAIEDLCDRMARASSVRFHCETDPQPRPLAREQRILLYRGLRELLHNIVKHAQARSARVGVHRTGSEIRILVEDDGVGFDVAALPGPTDTSSGFGLFSVREGLASVGGRLEIDSAPAKGSRIALVAPLEEGAVDA
jgi:PAS domain S-box-containing protein